MCSRVVTHTHTHTDPRKMQEGGWALHPQRLQSPQDHFGMSTSDEAHTVGGAPPSKQAARTRGGSTLERANQDSRIRHTFKHARHAMNHKHKRRGYYSADLAESRKLFTPHSHTSCGEGLSTWDCSSPREEVNRSISCSHLSIDCLAQF